MPASILSFPLPSAAAAPLATQLPAGRLIEIVGSGESAQMTTAITCLRQAQAQGETTAWIQAEGGSLFPPDLADSGIDLSALVVVNVPPPQQRQRGSAHSLAKAAELLLRSGGFGMVIVDLIGTTPMKDVAWQGRLFGLAREHHSWVLLLSDGHQRSGSLGPLVSLCIEPRRDRQGRGRFRVEHHIRKDKSGLLSPLTGEQLRGPWGLV